MAQSRIYHVGIVVASLEPAMRELSEATGITWGAPQRDVPTTYATPDGPRGWPVTFVYSTEPPYLELLERQDDSLWSELGLHHLGLWSGDVHGESLDLEQRGCTWQAAMSDGDGTRLGACYHLLPAASSRIELVSQERSQPRLERYLAGGAYL